MKLYPELCLEILRRTEETEGLPPPRHYEIEGFSGDEVGYNCLKLNEAGLLEVWDARSRDDLWGYYPKYLTSDGHEFLTKAASSNNWTKVTDRIKKSGGPLTLETIRLALSQERNRGTGMKVFISHNSNDEELAKCLVNLLQKSLRLESSDIRCSSVDGYQLEGGVTIDETLKVEVHEAELVIGLITPNSLKSLYVAFELGARWGISKPMIPILAAGVTSEHLEGPLSSISALSCNNEGQVLQLLEDAARHLGTEHEQRTSSYWDDIKRLSELSSVSQVVAERQATDSTTQQLSPEAIQMLTTAAKTSDGAIRVTRLMAGRKIQARGTNFNELGDPKSTAIWTDALNELLSKGLIRDDSDEGTFYEVSGKGFAYAAKLNE